MKEKIEEISLSMERGHRRILRVLSALAVIGLFAALWKWRGLAAMEPIVEGGQRRWLLAIGESIAVSLAAQWVLYLLPWPLLALFGRMTPFCSIFARRPCVGSNAELSRAAVLAVRLLPPVLVGAALWFAREAAGRDRSREDACAALMEAQLGVGQRAAAIDTYLSCRRYLVEELGIDPSPSIVALYRSAVEAEEALE